jgi:hypothetical protein
MVGKKRIRLKGGEGGCVERREEQKTKKQKKGKERKGEATG